MKEGVRGRKSREVGSTRGRKRNGEEGEVGRLLGMKEVERGSE